MKKLVIIALVCVMLFAMMAMVAPASAKGGGGSSGNSPVDGPPGWSQVNPGQGGSDGPIAPQPGHP